MSQVILENSVKAYLNRLTHLPKGTIIFKPDDVSDFIYYIVEGQVKVESTTSDTPFLKALHSTGEIFGEGALLDDQARTDLATCFTDVSIVKIGKDEYKKDMIDNPPLRLFMLEMISKRNAKLVRRLESYVNLNSRNRIIAFLIDLVENQGERVGYEYVVRQVMTHQEIADLTATSRQTVTMVLNELKNNDILTFNRRRLLIRDLDGLKEEILN